MARLPLVAIIGRPNTGKSTLFNRMVGSRIAIESEVAGTTRDHIAHKMENDELDYLLLDTGGMGGGTEDEDFEENVHGQSLLAIANADLILFTINAREELTSSDQEIVQILRKRKRGHVPVFFVPTKCDNNKVAEEARLTCMEIGLGETIYPVSAFHGIGVGDLEEGIIAELKKLHFEKAAKGSEKSMTRIAIIGKPNVGKSSMINALMSEEQRQTSPRLVSDIPGTTRDTTDTVIRYEGKEYLFVDTAGLKRNAKTQEGIDQYAMLRSIQALQEADIAVLLVDAHEPISKQDKRIADLAVESGKGLLILLNKSDLLTPEEKKEKLIETEAALSFCPFAVKLFVSAKTRAGLLKMFDQLETIKTNRERRIPTKELRNWFSRTIEGQPMRPLNTAKHITQAEELPPTFVLFVRDPSKIEESKLRFLERRMREAFDFSGTPVRFLMRAKGGKETRDA